MADTTNTHAEHAGGYPAVYRNLMVVGLLGACYQVHEDAQKVNDAVESTLQDPTAFRMYRALAQGMGGDSEYAAEQLRKRMDEAPDDDKAKLTLAVALMLAGNPEWKGLVENVLATSTDQVAREAATNLVQYLTSLRVH
jgi:thioredoxin-like negative regulator of GroEL